MWNTCNDFFSKQVCLFEVFFFFFMVALRVIIVVMTLVEEGLGGLFVFDFVDTFVFILLVAATDFLTTPTASAVVLETFITLVVFFFLDNAVFCLVARMDETFVVLFSFDDGLVVPSEVPSDDDVDTAFLSVVFFFFAMVMQLK